MRLVLGLVLCLIAVPAWGQFGDFSRTNPNTISDNPLFRTQDSLRYDTTGQRPKRRKVLVMHPSVFLRTDRFLDTLPSLDRWRYTLWDELDTLPGFAQRLGQIGKPYQRYAQGLPDRLLPSPHYRDPLTGKEWAYLLDPYYQIPHLDTRTLFSEIAFHQADNNQQMLRAVFSQNVTPFWNWTVLYRRRTAEGRYPNQRTDQYNIALSTYYRSFDQRWAAFANAAYNEVADNISGGIAAGGQVDPDSLFRDVTLDDADQVLNRARLLLRVRTLTAGGTYRLLGDTLNNLSLVAGASLVEHNHRWTDNQTIITDRDAYLQQPNRAYANLIGIGPDDTLTGVRVGYVALARAVHGGVRFNARLWRFDSRHDLQVRYESNTYWGEDSLMPGPFGLQRQGLRYVAVTGDTSRIQAFRLQWQLDLSRNNRMATELFGQVSATWTLGRQRYLVRDSIWREFRGRWVRRPIVFEGDYAPWQFQVSGYLASQNPTVLDRFWTTRTFEANPSLGNERVLRVQGWAQYTRPLKSFRGVAYLPTYVRLGGFWSQRAEAILYDSLGQAVQLPAGSTIRWTGVQLTGRGRLGRFYLEVDATAQRGEADAAAAPYGANQPSVFGRASLFYSNKVFRRGNTFLHVGLDAYYFDGYRGLHFDPSTIRFYPQTAPQLDDVLRVDVVISANILTAVAFLKIQNALHNLTTDNYVTTPYYPELRRTLVWGVGWRLYD